MGNRRARVLWLLVALGGAGFAACSSDNFTNDRDSGTPAEAGPDVCASNCDAGVTAPVVLASGLRGPYGIAVRGNALYVTEFVAHGRVLRFAKH